ncbi:hypothetical protein [Kitasatospora sp. NPDC004289]
MSAWCEEEETARFLAVSAELTGHTEGELIATGRAGEYRAVALRELGPEGLRQVLRDGARPGAPLDGARALALLWYTGSWALGGGLPVPVSARAYEAGLVWRAVGTHAPGAGADGFGGWSQPPVPGARP